MRVQVQCLVREKNWPKEFLDLVHFDVRTDRRTHGSEPRLMAGTMGQSPF